MWMFKGTGPPAELIKQNKRLVEKSIREIDRAKLTVEVQEKKLVLDIKSMINQNRMSNVKTMAKELVRTRDHVSKLLELQSHLRGVAMRMQTLSSTQAMGDAMRGTTLVMANMNKSMNSKSIDAVMRDFQRQNAKMEHTAEVLGDGIGEAMATEGEDDTSDALVSQVLDELGFNINMNMVDVPMNKIVPVEEAPSISFDAELEERYKKLSGK